MRKNRAAVAAVFLIMGTSFLAGATSGVVPPVIVTVAYAQANEEEASGPAPDATAKAEAANKDYKVLKDIPYLGAGHKEKMDAYLPDPKKFPGLRPAVIVIHGGAWYKGDKATAREIDICGTLASAGYACFSINYALSVYKDKVETSPLIKHGWPDNFQDCRDAIRYVRRQAAAYSVDPAHIALLGCSAGGHLALLTAVAPATLKPRVSSAGAEADAATSTSVDCVVYMYGRYHLRDRLSAWPPAVLGNDIVTVASPETYFSRSIPPVLIIQGDKDKTVPPKMASDLADSLQKLGVKHELVWVPGVGHMFNLHPPGGKDIVTPVLKFLGENMKSAAR